MPVCVVAANACTTAGLPKSSHPISCHDNRLLSDYRSIYLLSAILQSFEETAKWAAAVERHENRSSKRNPKNRIESNRFESREKNRMNATNRTTDPVSIYMLVFFCFQVFVINRLKQQATTLYQPCPWRTRRRRRRPASASTTEWVNHPVHNYLQSIGNNFLLLLKCNNWKKSSNFCIDLSPLSLTSRRRHSHPPLVPSQQHLLYSYIWCRVLNSSFEYIFLPMRMSINPLRGQRVVVCSLMKM